MNDQTVIEAVLNYNPGNTKKKKRNARREEKDVPIHKSPILLSFLCLLAKEDNIDLSNTKMHTGEIYLRMICCLYKKYMIRKGKGFDTVQFVAAMTSVGKLALKTLLSGEPMLRRADVIKEIGEDAFDYGLLIGHEDFRLIRDETADIFVTFPHRSVQEFLVAFYFIRMLNEGKEIRSVLDMDSNKQPIFLKNTLFLQFCLFLCSDQKYFPLKNRQKYFPLENRQRVYQSMVNYCVEWLNKAKVDMKDIEYGYPALDISSKSSYAKDKLRVIFLGDILAKCDKASSLVLSHYHPLNQFLGFIKPNLKSITFIQHEKAEHRISYSKGTEIAIEAKYSTWDKLSDILKHYNKVVVRLYIHSSFSLMCPARKGSFPNVKTLCLSEVSYKFKEANEFITFAPDLTEMHLDRVFKEVTLTEMSGKAFHIDIPKEVTMEQMINKMSGGNHQNVSYLSFDDCDVDVQGKLPVLFESVWPNLNYLSLLGTRLLDTDLEFLCSASNGPEKTLPNLTSLCLSVPIDLSMDAFWAKLFSCPWMNLKSLYLKSVCDPSGLNKVIKDQKLLNLSCLRIRNTTKQQAKHDEALFLDQLVNLQSVYLDEGNCGHIQIVHSLLLSELSIHCRDDPMGFVSPLSVPGFSKLTALAVNNCALESEHLASLAQAKVNGGLPALRNLDISQNQSSLPEFKCLFTESCTWSELLSLDIRQTFKYDEHDQAIDYLNEIVSRGYLSSLQKLGIRRFENKNVPWKNLEKIFLIDCTDDTLRNIAVAKKRYLPALQTLCIRDFEGHDADLVRQLDVSCHRTCIPRGNRFSSAKCHCEL